MQAEQRWEDLLRGIDEQSPKAAQAIAGKVPGEEGTGSFRPLAAQSNSTTF